ncbi:SEC-C domain-containing protein [Mycobacterium sp. SM1]|nr:SEC-C domain-containing protein [Mycobacterium sp. SM1]
MAETLDTGAILADVLAAHGPLHEDEIARRLHECGVADPDGVLDQLLDETECPAGQLVDDRWVWLPRVLAGRVFTHRLSADEAAHDLLTVTPDLDPITALCGHERYRRLADGSPVLIVLAGFDGELLEQRGVPAEAVDRNGALLLAPGTLGALGVAAGDLVGVRLSEEGLVLERVTALADAPLVGRRLAATLGDDEPVYFDAAVWTACVEEPKGFTEPLAPLCELIGEHGLSHRGEWLASGGFDFDRWFFERGCAALAERHELEAADAVALYALLLVYDQMALLLMAAAAAHESPPHDGPATTMAAEPSAPERFLELVGELGAALAEPRLAELLVAETVGAGHAGAVALGVFAEALEPRVPRPARVACRWLRAVALERLGDLEAAERNLLAAESMDPGWPLPLLDLARIASDRGDAERGLALLRRAGAEPDHPLAELLERHRPEPRRDLGRNQPCWCGSGRKYKKCHLGRERLPLAGRADWLYAKAIQHALLGGWNGLLVEAGYQRYRYTHQDPDALAAALADPLVIDAVLFEGGAFAEFVAARGSLLPEDERLLAEQWLLVERSVFEVERVRAGQSVTVRDVRSGDRHEVREGGRGLRPGQLICARVLPTGDGERFVGGLEPVALHERDHLIDLLDAKADAVTLVATLSRRCTPPAFASTEGDAEGNEVRRASGPA